MEYDLKTGSQGHIYFPKKIRQSLGPELKFLPNAEAGAIYPKDADLGRVVQSLEVIIADLKLRATKPKARSRKESTKTSGTRTNGKEQ